MWNAKNSVVITALVVSIVLIFGSTPSSAESFDYKNPPQGVFYDEWMNVDMLGQKVGYMHLQMSRAGEDVNTQSLMTISLKRVGSPVTISTLQTTTETLSGEPRKFTSEMDASVQKLHMHGTIQDGKVTVASKQYGAAVVNKYDFPTGAVMVWGNSRIQAKMGYATGTEYSFDMYEPSLAADTSGKMDVKIVGKETIEHGGKQVQAIHVTQKTRYPAMPGEMVTETWMNEDGIPLKSSSSLIGMQMILVRTTKDKALADFSPPEFFMPTTIKVNRSIDREKARRIEFQLLLKDKTQQMSQLPQTDMQTPGEVSGHSARLIVQRLDHQSLKKVEKQSFGPEFAEFLKANPIINSDDPAVLAMAKEARRDANKPYEIADNLRKYVTTTIKNKNLDVGFASASEVCRNKEGDCSEHAVLLAALGRACGLPSRIVCGLVYVPVFGGADDIFGFHMWTQFRIGDKWVDFDAAQMESDCNPTHIAFGVSSLQNSGLGQIVFGLINVIGNLELKIEKIELAGN